MASIIETLLFKIGVEDATVEGFRRVESKFESFKDKLGGLGERTEKLRQALHLAGVSTDSFAAKAVHTVGIVGSMIGKFSPLEMGLTAVTAAVALGAKAWEMWNEQATQAQKALDNEVKGYGEKLKSIDAVVKAKQQEARFFGMTDGQKQIALIKDEIANLETLKQALADSGHGEIGRARLEAADRQLAQLRPKLQELRMADAVLAGKMLGRQIAKDITAEIEKEERERQAAIERYKKYLDELEKLQNRAYEDAKKYANEHGRDMNRITWKWAQEYKKSGDQRQKQDEDAQQAELKRSIAAADEIRKGREETKDQVIANAEMVGEAMAGLTQALIEGDEAALKSFVKAQAQRALSEAIVASARAVGYQFILGMQQQAIEQAKLAALLFAAAATLGVISGSMSGGGGGGSASAPASPQSFAPASGEGGPTNIYYISGHQINTATGYDKVFSDGSRRYEQSQKPKSKRSRF